VTLPVEDAPPPPPAEVPVLRERFEETRAGLDVPEEVPEQDVSQREREYLERLGYLRDH
jgi:hypothetical protein